MRNGVRTVINGFIFTLATHKYVTSSQGVQLCNILFITSLEKEYTLFLSFLGYYSVEYVLNKTNDKLDEITNIVMIYS